MSHYSLSWVLTNASFDVLKLSNNIHLIVQSKQLTVEYVMGYYSPWRCDCVIYRDNDSGADRSAVLLDLLIC